MRITAHQDDIDRCEIERRERLFIRAVSEIEHARVKVDAAHDANAASRVDDGIARREKEAAEAAEVRLHVENLRARGHLAERREPGRGVRDIDAALMTRTPE